MRLRVIVTKIKEVSGICCGTGICAVCVSSSLTASKWIFFRVWKSVLFCSGIQCIHSDWATDLSFWKALCLLKHLYKIKDSFTIYRCVLVLEIMLPVHLVARSSKICTLYVASVCPPLEGSLEVKNSLKFDSGRNVGKGRGKRKNLQLSV